MQDDGRGINEELIKEIAEKKRIPIPADEDISDLLFEQDFSTREVVTEISGRGIGLNAVLLAARELGGDARIKKQDKGGFQIHIKFKKKSLQEIFST
jgi:two-component system chemotaxis sensor kinase CheA